MCQGNVSHMKKKDIKKKTLGNNRNLYDAYSELVDTNNKKF
jgi:hypothetical protein